MRSENCQAKTRLPGGALNCSRSVVYLGYLGFVLRLDAVVLVREPKKHLRKIGDV